MAPKLFLCSRSLTDWLQRQRHLPSSFVLFVFRKESPHCRHFLGALSQLDMWNKPSEFGKRSTVACQVIYAQKNQTGFRKRRQQSAPPAALGRRGAADCTQRLLKQNPLRSFVSRAETPKATLTQNVLSINLWITNPNWHGPTQNWHVRLQANICSYESWHCQRVHPEISKMMAWFCFVFLNLNVNWLVVAFT